MSVGNTFPGTPAANRETGFVFAWAAQMQGGVARMRTYFGLERRIAAHAQALPVVQIPPSAQRT